MYPTTADRGAEPDHIPRSIGLPAFLRGFPARHREWWRNRPPGLAERLVNLAGIVVAVGWLCVLFLPHAKMICQPGPQEYNEPATWYATFLLDHGRNPYTEAELPGSALGQGPFYNLVVLAFKPMFGTDYAAHRMVNLVFLAASLWLLVGLMQRAGAGLGIALLSMTFYYWMCLNNIMISARADAPGLFFFLLGLFVPWENNYSRRSSVFGLVCALLSFQFKGYFAVAGCATLLGTFFVRSKREACWLGVAYFALLILSLAVTSLFFPYFFIETIIGQYEGAKVNAHDDISAMHTVMLFGRAWPYMLVMLLGFGAWLWRRQADRRAGRTASESGQEAWYADMRYRVLGVVFLIFLALVYFYMGHNAGAYFTYHLHLLFPLMFVLTALTMTRAWQRILFGLLLMAFVMFWLNNPGGPDSTVPYHRMEQLVNASQGEVLGIPCTTDIFARTGRRVLHDGSSMFLGFCLADNRAARNPQAAAIVKMFDDVGREVERKVAAREYVLVLTEFDNPMYCSEELLKKNYDQVEQIDYYTYFGHSPVRVWRPKPRQPDAGPAPGSAR